MASNVFWTISLVLSWVSPISSEMVLTISFLVTSRVPYENGHIGRSQTALGGVSHAPSVIVPSTSVKIVDRSANDVSRCSIVPRFEPRPMPVSAGLRMVNSNCQRT